MRLVVFVVSACVVTACRVAPPTVVTTLDGSRQVSSLNTAESRQYCRDAVRYNDGNTGDDETKALSCFVKAAGQIRSAATDAEAQAMCRTAFDACLAMAGTPVFKSPNELCSGSLESGYAKCNATVAEKNECIEDYVAHRNEVLLSDPCSLSKATPGWSAIVTRENAPEWMVPSCEAIQTRCPGPWSIR
jgi:hypothetical protein